MNSELLLTEEGLRTLKNNEGFKERLLDRRKFFLPTVLMRRGATGLVEKINIGTFRNPYFLAIKYLYDENHLPAHIGFMSGKELLGCYLDLKEEGILVAEPLAATRNRFVTKWVSQGKKFPDVDKWDHERKRQVHWDFEKYICKLQDLARKFKEEGRWAQDWTIDIGAQNYLAIEPNETPSYTFIAIDPVFHQKVLAYS